MMQTMRRAGGAQRNPPIGGPSAGSASLHPPYKIVNERRELEDAK